MIFIGYLFSSVISFRLKLKRYLISSRTQNHTQTDQNDNIFYPISDQHKSKPLRWHIPINLEEYSHQGGGGRERIVAPVISTALSQCVEGILGHKFELQFAVIFYPLKGITKLLPTLIISAYYANLRLKSRENKRNYCC